MDLLDVAGELYALPPQEFTAARDDQARQARAAGAKDVGQQVRRFARPTASAWVVNALVRGDPDVLDELLALGAALREAQDATGEHVRRLTARRRELLAAAVTRARALAEERGQPVSRATVDEVEATLRSAVADVDAARAVRSGRLTRALAASGLGTVDVSGAVALPESLPPAPAPLRVVGQGATGSAGPAARSGSADSRPRAGEESSVEPSRSGTSEPGQAQPERAQQERAEREARAALRRAASAAAAARDEAAEAEAAAVARHEQLRERVRAARQDLHDLEQQAGAAAGAARAAREEHRRAAQAARTAEGAAGRAEAGLPHGAPHP